VAIKLALVLQVVLLFGTALLRPAKALVAALAVLFLLGLPTAVGDVYCAQDNSSRPYTLRVPAEEMALARWIAANLPPDAVVQASPRRREWFFSIVPVFAERPTFLGDRMHLETFLIDPASGRDRLAALASALEGVNEPQGREWLSASPIEYLFYGRREAQEYPEPREMEAVARFGSAKLFRVPKGDDR
jgi:hypothetical protein